MADRPSWFERLGSVADDEAQTVPTPDGELVALRARLTEAEAEIVLLRASNRLRGQRAARERSRRAYTEGELDAMEDIAGRTADDLRAALASDDVGNLVNQVIRSVDRLHRVSHPRATSGEPRNT